MLRLRGSPPRSRSDAEEIVKQSIRACLLTAAALIALTGGPVRAADPFPSSTVKIVVPNPAGGSADSVPRIVADVLSKTWGQPVVIENRAGAAGNIGAEFVFRAQPDGYTLLASPPTTLSINQSLYKKLNYDATAFKLITILGSAPNVLIVNPKLGVSTVKELIDKAKADPGGITYASQGIGATSHLTTALFETMAGVKFNHVPYRGTAPAMNDLLGGHVQFMFDNLASSLPQHQAKTLEILAICTPERSPLLKDVPTMAESGLPGFVSIAWFGLAAPPGTPDDIVAKINEDVAAALKTEDVRQRFAGQGVQPLGYSVEETVKFVESERKLWGAVIQKANLKVDD
jgi:tripartite-type tricarboxylate transporter receptor subunit TctC